MRPRVLIGVPLHNQATHLPQALESLLGQTCREAAFVLVDDASKDATQEIALRWAAIDERIHYFRSDRRLGLVRAWRRAFELATELYPEAEYFAWGSDHDVWHPRWLEALLDRIESAPETVAVYPQSLKLRGSALPAGAPWRFDTARSGSPLRRLAAVVWRASAGYMVYGLFRVSALRRAGVFREVLLPDRLLFAELALQGRFEQVGELLWYRRPASAFSLERQRRSFFPTRVPLRAHAPWWAAHAAVLFWNYGVRGRGGSHVGRLRGIASAIAYALVSLTAHVRSRISYRRRFLRTRLQSLRRRLALLRDRARSAPEIARRLARIAPRELRRKVSELRWRFTARARPKPAALRPLRGVERALVLTPGDPARERRPEADARNLPRRVLFVLRHPGYVRNFETAIASLARRGHRVSLLFEREDKQGERSGELVARLCEESPVDAAIVSIGGAPWSALAMLVRTTLDYLRYLDPTFQQADAFRARVGDRLPGLARSALAAVGACGPRARELVRRLFTSIERSLPVHEGARAVIDALRPDVVLVTPLVDIGSDQVEFVKAARAAGIPSLLPVTSWDNLTNKGVMRIAPDVVTVWNELQKGEAVAWHGAPESCVRVTGAPAYDHWFDWQPSRTRGDFFATVGLEPAQHLILYVGSSQFIARNEVDFAHRWIEAIRASQDPGVAGAAILIRPHPQNFAQWEHLDVARLSQVRIWPERGANPLVADARRDYFDSLFHSSAVVGINTSAQIEASIVGRPVLTVLDADFAETQAKAAHFAMLTEAGADLLNVSSDLRSHCRELARLFAEPAAARERSRRFVECFVRPLGHERRASDALADEVERLAIEPARAAVSPTPSSYVAGVALRPFAWLASALARRASASRHSRRARLRRAASAERSRTTAAMTPRSQDESKDAA
jgi:glycosyltransferase involved in cell wall biosynthesis